MKGCWFHAGLARGWSLERSATPVVNTCIITQDSFAEIKAVR